MSKRTINASRAVAAAWTNEQRLVQDGKGTRDWTPKQQKDILERGKAYDEDGRAFQGHHMKSVEAYPDYQGMTEDIQFLSWQEHLDAHGGSFQNPTNGYFNPQTYETTIFTAEELFPCKIIDLSSPVATIQISESQTASDETVNPKLDAKTASDAKLETPKTESSTTVSVPYKRGNQSSRFVTGLHKIGRGLMKIGKYAVQHPIQTIGVVAAGLGTVIEVANIIGGRSSGHDSGNSDGCGSERRSVGGRSISTDCDYYSDSDSSDDAIEEDSSYDDVLSDVEPDADLSGTPKSTHIRRAHVSHVWTGPRSGEQIRKEVWIDEIKVNDPSKLDSEE